MNKFIYGLIGLLLVTGTAHAKGKIQNEDIKSLAELTTAGGVMSQLPNDTKIYVTANGINTQLSTAIQSGVIGGGASGGGGFNVLKNPGFEVGLTNWSNTGGTFAAISSGGNLLVGQGSATFQASGSGQFMQSTSYTVPNGLAGTPCVVGALYKGGSTTLSLQAYDGTNVLASVALTPQSTPVMQYATFQCPTSGSFRARVISSGSSALVALDQMFLGQNTINQVSQATYYGGVIMPAGCSLSNAGSPGHTDLTPAGCTGSSVLGNVSSFDDVTTGYVTLNNAPPGEYFVVWTGQYQTAVASTNSDIIITDGTTISQQQNSFVATISNVNAPMSLSGHFSYTTAGTRVFRLQGAGSVQHGIGFGQTAESLSIYRYPTQEQTLINANTINWNVEARIGGANLGLGITSPGLAQFVLDPANTLSITNFGSLPATKPCVGTLVPPAGGTGGCAGAGQPVAGVAFTPPASQKVEVCMEWNVAVQAGSTSVGMYDSFNIYQTPADDDSVNTEVGGNYSTYSAVDPSSAELHGGRQTICENFNVIAGVPTAFRLFNAAIVTSGTITRNEAQFVNTTGGGSSSGWVRVRPITQSMPAPVFLPPAAFHIATDSGFPTGSVGSSPTLAVWNPVGPTSSFDTNNGYSTATGYYTVPAGAAGLWYLQCKLNITSTVGTDYQFDAQIIKNGGSTISFYAEYFDATTTATRSRIPSTTVLTMLNVGDYVGCFGATNVGGSWSGDQSSSYFEGHLVH